MVPQRSPQRQQRVASALYPRAAALRLIALSLLTSHFSLLTSHFSLLTSFSALPSRAASRPATHHESPPCFSPEGDTSIAGGVSRRGPAADHLQPGGRQMRCGAVSRRTKPCCRLIANAPPIPERSEEALGKCPARHAARGVSSALPGHFTRGLPPCGSSRSRTAAHRLLTSHFRRSPFAQRHQHRVAAPLTRRLPPGGSSGSLTFHFRHSPLSRNICPPASERTSSSTLSISFRLARSNATTACSRG
ncbi:MAG: hypothetical protein RLZZ436_465 [Planctomycetota bacterium]